MILAVTVAGGLGLAQRAAEIDPVERQDDVGLAQQARAPAAGSTLNGGR